MHLGIAHEEETDTRFAQDIQKFNKARGLGSGDNILSQSLSDIKINRGTSLSARGGQLGSLQPREGGFIPRTVTQNLGLDGEQKLGGEQEGFRMGGIRDVRQVGSSTLTVLPEQLGKVLRFPKGGVGPPSLVPKTGPPQPIFRLGTSREPTSKPIFNKEGVQIGLRGITPAQQEAPTSSASTPTAPVLGEIDTTTFEGLVKGVGTVADFTRNLQKFNRARGIVPGGKGKKKRIKTSDIQNRIKFLQSQLNEGIVTEEQEAGVTDELDILNQFIQSRLGVGATRATRAKEDEQRRLDLEAIRAS